MLFTATWIQLEIIIMSEISKKRERQYHMISLICGTYSMAQMNLSTGQKRHTDVEIRLVVAKEYRVESGMERQFGVRGCKLLYLEWVKNEVLLHSTGNYIQSLVI